MKKLFISISIALVVLVAACSPKATPVPSTARSPKPAATSVPTKAPTAASQDAAWAKVVADAKKEGKVVLSSTSFTGDTPKALSEAFEKKYGIKLEFITGISSVHIARIKTEQAAGKHESDTLDGPTGSVNLAKKEGITEPVGSLQELTNRDVWTAGFPVADPEGHIVGFRSLTDSAYVNTTLVKTGEEPKSYKELLEPKWKGKVTFPSPVTTMTTISVYLALRKAGIDDEYWRQLAKQEPKIGPSIREPLSWLSRGEAAVLLGGASDSTLAPSVKEGAPIKAIEMAEGLFRTPAGVSLAVLKNPPHPNAARVFINWIISQEGQTLYSQVLGGVTPFRKDVADVRPVPLRLEPKRVHIVDYAMLIEATKVQVQGTMAKALGLEK